MILIMTNDYDNNDDYVNYDDFAVNVDTKVCIIIVHF